MPTAIAKYTVRRPGFVLCVVPLQKQSQVVEVFDRTEVTIPGGRGYAIFLNREHAFASVLIEKVTVGVAGELVKQLVYFIHRRLHDLPKPPERPEGEDYDQFYPRYQAFAGEMEESRGRVSEWCQAVEPMLTEALSVLED